MVLARVPGRAVGRRVAHGGNSGTGEGLELGGLLGRLQTRGRGGQHWGQLIGSLGKGVVGLLCGLAGEIDRAGSVA